MSAILFVGNFLSATRGSLSPTERLIERLKSEGLRCLQVSGFENQLVRLLDMIFAGMFANYSVIHIDTFSNKAFRFADILSRIAKWRGKTVILNLHGGQLPEFYAQHKMLVTSTFHRADHLVSPSRFLCEFFREQGFEIQHIQNFIDPSFFENNGEMVKTHSILWVRAFAAIYQPQKAIESVVILKKQYPDVQLTMLGPDHGLMHECRELISRLGLEKNVHVAGFINNESLGQYYRTHAVFLNTSVYESFGMAILEASATGLPTVSTSVGEIPLMWNDGEDILLAQNNDAESFAQHISQLFEHEQYRRWIGEQARIKARNFSWENVRSSWLSLYQSKQDRHGFVV